MVTTDLDSDTPQLDLEPTLSPRASMAGTGLSRPDPALTSCLHLGLASLPWTCLRIWTSGWTSVPSLGWPPFGGAAGQDHGQGGPGAAVWFIALSSWLPVPWEAAAPCCGHFIAVCYNLQLQRGRKITKTANPPPQNGEQFFITWDLA